MEKFSSREEHQGEKDVVEQSASSGQVGGESLLIRLPPATKFDKVYRFSML
jgi:hypothetical protein